MKAADGGRGRIPEGYHRRLELYLGHLGYEIDDVVFGYTLDQIIAGANEGNRLSTAA